MQKILSSFVFRDYSQYTPEQVEIFRRRSSSKPSQTHAKSALVPTTASNEEAKNSHHKLSENVEITQFNVQNVIDELGQAVEQVQQKLKLIWKNEEHRNEEHKPLPKIQEKESCEKSEPSTRVTKKTKGSYIKSYQQKMQAKRQEIKSGKQKNNSKFDLAEFKNKLNYKMFNRIAFCQ